MFISVIVLLFTVTYINAIDPLVTIPSGTLRGYYDKAPNGRVFAAFEGVPYARPPLGKYRFREPQPLKPWKGVWIANQTVKCLQYDHFSTDPDRVNGQEDCLYVNVYSPVVSQTALLDVIIHIHGGAFMFGAGHQYGPKLLMENDVVFVNFNYRLGPLGFLSTNDDVVPGNNGLKDQSMALKWIKDNIQYFGGNPNSITLTGLSAGGASVTYHYLSPMSAGLFHRGIALSGSALNPWAQTEAVFEKTKTLAASLGCDAVSNRDMVDCLRYRPAKHIVSKVPLFMPFLYNPYSPFGPVVEKFGLNPFLSQSPYDALRQGKVNDVPLLMSFVKDEGLYPGAEFQADPQTLPELEKRWTELAPHILDYNYTVPQTEHASVAEKVKTYYLNGQAISSETYGKLIQMIGDRLFVTTIETSAKLFARVMTSPVYLSYFTYRGYYSKSQVLSTKTDNFGVCHADDLIYVLSFDLFNPFQTEEDNLMKTIVVNLWLSFAKNGVPEIPGIDFTPVSKTKGPLNYLHIESPSKISMKSADTLSHKQFWDSLPFDENQATVQLKEEL